jgi:hypothetical protein
MIRTKKLLVKEIKNGEIKIKINHYYMEEEEEMLD